MQNGYERAGNAEGRASDSSLLGVYPKAQERPTVPRRLSWKPFHNKGKDPSASGLVTPKEGEELHSYAASTSRNSATSLASPTPFTPIASAPLSRASSRVSEGSTPPSSRPTTPLTRWSSPHILTKEQIEQQQANQNALERTSSKTDPKSASFADVNSGTRGSGSFGRMSFSSMMGGLSSLSLSRTSTNDDRDRGRRKSKEEERQRARSSSTSHAAAGDAPAEPTTSLRSRSTSPFRLRRNRTRDPSPTVGALSQSDAESDSEPSRVRPRNAYTSDDEGESQFDSDESEDDWSDDQFDPVTERNTERNALVVPADMPDADGLDAPDPLGEGVNVLIPPEPYFPSTLNHTSGRNPRRRKSVRQEPLPLATSRPVFKRDRCTITVTNGDPVGQLAASSRRSRKYIIGSDMSDESRYAVEWGIGTVLRDGDELLIVTVVENEAKVDPPVPNNADRTTKLRSQQERQGMAYILCRQATSLLQRTKLHVTVQCEAWHAKNARHMLLDIVDHVDPVMLIVGSRGLGQIKGILLGSTSHYLIQKCSVPVMVARRRLKRPPRRSAHLAKHRARVSLAEAAGVERVTPRVDEEVAHMRDEIQREDEDERQHGNHTMMDADVRDGEGVDVEGDGDDDEEGVDGEVVAKKVAGE